jgi:predicted lipoprotein with Yx(FWY)xxD motif
MNTGEKNTMRLKNLVCSLGLALLLVGILAACGSTYSTASANTLATTLKTSITANVSQKISSSVVVSVGKVPSHQAVGSKITVLTTIKGFTLYVHEWQGASGFTCDGSCAKTWKPLVYNGTGTPTSTTKLPGKLSVGTDAQGHKVVFYQGYPLYTYVGDKKPGDFNAPLADNLPWQLATLDLPIGL